MKKEITKEQYDKLCKFHEELKNLSEPKRVYDEQGNVYYEVPEFK